MARRGEELREHILWVAKDVFLEMGFERASMDIVASRAQTSKRSLYAHFESKEKLFLAIIELVRGLFLTRLKMPADYSDKPAEALSMFCGRYLEILLYESSIQMCRVCASEAARFPEGAAQHFDLMFNEVATRLANYVKARFGLTAHGATDAAQTLLGRILYPRFPRALFGIDPLAKRFGDDTISSDFDIKPIRAAVADFLKSVSDR